MNITELSIAAAAALLIGLAGRKKAYPHLLLAASVLIIYWFQGPNAGKGLVFWLPTLTLSLACLAWIVTTPSGGLSWRKNLPALALMTGMVLLLNLTGMVWKDNNPIIDYPLPAIQTILAALALIVLIGFLLARFSKFNPAFLWLALIGIVAIFIILKTPDINFRGLKYLLGLIGQKPSKIEPLPWLGFSYAAFRILHTIRDRQSGRLPTVSLAEYVSYVIFFPSFVAGPIDRLERFVGDLRAPLALQSDDWLFAGRRIFVGLFKKFVVANTLAAISLNVKIATGAVSPGWMWFFVYAYTFQIYFDFSGYTDIAIGIARLAGIRLPENFNAPYLKPNLTQFWNNWHMTLTQWFRSYFFNPISRVLRSSKIPLPAWLIILIMQIATMSLIGLWHGITLNFALWGLWHGFGLFIHNRWSDLARPRVQAWAATPLRQNLVNAIGVLLTFHYVALGWVFFALPSPELSLRVFATLFGLN
jgi:D-alanyl-lipoteichoic acid acyltransferase DltB (MBOAT superfamily)